jgi:hypothetical protein
MYHLSIPIELLKMESFFLVDDTLTMRWPFSGLKRVSAQVRGSDGVLTVLLSMCSKGDQAQLDTRLLGPRDLTLYYFYRRISIIASDPTVPNPYPSTLPCIDKSAVSHGPRWNGSAAIVR